MTDSVSSFTRRWLLGLSALAAASGPAQAYGGARVTRVSSALPGLRFSVRVAVLVVP